MKLYDTTNEDLLFELNLKKDELSDLIISKGCYDVNDFALVRTTDYLPQDNVIKPICDVPFVTHINSPFRDAIYRKLSNERNINPFNEDEYDAFMKEIDNYTPLSTQYRSTIHFTLNGLVSSHDKGNFEGRNFIIIDKLGKHLGNDNIKSVRMEDTYMMGNVTLSSDAIILVDESMYQKLLDVYPYLENYNVVLYKGDPKIAVEMVLAEQKICPEEILSSYAKYTERTPLYTNFIAKLNNTYSIESTPHYQSEVYKEDDNKSLELWKYYDFDFMKYLLNKFVDNDEEKSQLLNSFNEIYFDREKCINYVLSIIKQIGLDRYIKLVGEYNLNIMSNIQKGDYPTNNEILESNNLSFSNNNQR